jgi:hypothetical protein
MGDDHDGAVGFESQVDAWLPGRGSSGGERFRAQFCSAKRENVGGQHKCAGAEDAAEETTSIDFKAIYFANLDVHDFTPAATLIAARMR